MFTAVGTVSTSALNGGRIPLLLLGPANSTAASKSAEASRTDRSTIRAVLLAMGFDIAIEALRFVLVDGTYVPTDRLFAADRVGLWPQKTAQPVGFLMGREHSVVRAIKEGRSNTIIAHDLNMCGNTVKVHVRNVMKKFDARNRTEVAMKA